MQEYQYALDILKEFFILAVINQMHRKAQFWAQLKKTSKGVYGRRIVIPVQMSFTEAVGSRAPNDYALPDAQRNVYDRAYIEIKRNYGRVSVDGLLIAASKGAGGFIDAFSGETKGISSSSGIDLDRQSFMDGAGRLALAVGAPTGQNLDVKDPGGITGDTPETKFLRKGMKVDIWEADWSALVATNVEIVAIVDANTITFKTGDDVSSVGADDIIVRHKSYSASGWGDMMGINGIINDVDPPTGDFEDIDRATNPEWKSYKNTDADVITDMVMQEDLDGISQNTDGENPTLALTTYAIRRKLIADAKGSYRTENLELKAGWKGIKFVGGEVELPIMAHKFTPVGYMYYISIPHIKFYALKKLVWDTSGGGTVKPVANNDAYEAWFKMYGNIGTDCSNAHGVHTGLTLS